MPSQPSSTVRTLASALVLVSLSPFASTASAQEVVFDAGSDNGFFTPFNSANAATVKYGDSGWIGTGASAPVALGRITLNLATFGSTTPGTTDLVFTFNDGDPSRLVFGTGDTLYTTTITGVELPAAKPGSAAFFSIDIPLPSVLTRGGFNDIGWSVSCANYNFAGQFGFQVSTCNAQTVGFYTNNASFFSGFGWSLFAFGQNPCTQVANFSATVYKAECLGDIDLSGAVDAGDLAVLLGTWGDAGKGIPADLNGDGLVDASDLAALLGNWGGCPG
ncbi:MAG: hypothetical protein GC172_06965 [Phycisphaera sp.]|nr:hypothetical protein [Phycisphaera sp.]